MTIRKVLKRDRAPLLSIVSKCDNLTCEERDCAIELLDIYLEDEGQEDYLFYGATGSDDALLGFICYGDASLADGVFDIYWIVVDSEARRGGVGGELVSHVEEILKGIGARKLYAETSGLESYKEAREFYEARGFTCEAQLKDFFKVGDDKLIYVKDLS